MKRVVALAVPCLTTLAACTTPPDETAAEHTEQAALTACGPSAMLPGTSGERRRVLERGAVWVNAPLPYSQSTWHEGYRQDCSGFVGMAWRLPGSMTTANLPPRTDSSPYAHVIDWNDLKPGDAISRGPTSLSRDGHVRLFVGRTAQGEHCFWEQALSFFGGGGTQINIYARERTEEDGFVPIRNDDL